jgi:hypothetical protein
MKAATTTVLILIRLAWLILLAIGVLAWTGRARPLIPAHQALGVAFVLMLWALAHLGMRAGAAPVLVTVVLGWSLILLVLGLTQTRILTGSLHWIIQVLHLVVGVASIGLAEALGARIKRRLSRPA